MSADLLANVERPERDRPVPSPERVDPHAGYWLGSAGSRVEHWRRRALAAEAEVERLRKIVGP
jgi:hypothetical protein